MTLDPGPAWLRWLPADSRAGLRRRFLIVWAVAAVIALLQRYVNPAQHPLDQALVYSYAISTATWFLADPLRIVLRRWLRTEGPYYWSFNARSLLHQLLSALQPLVEAIAFGDPEDAASFAGPIATASSAGRARPLQLRSDTAVRFPPSAPFPAQTRAGRTWRA